MANKNSDKMANENSAKNFKDDQQKQTVSLEATSRMTQTTSMIEALIIRTKETSSHTLLNAGEYNTKKSYIESTLHIHKKYGVL